MLRRRRPRWRRPAGLGSAGPSLLLEDVAPTPIRPSRRHRRRLLVVLAALVVLNTGLETYLRKDLPTTTQAFTPDQIGQERAQRYFPQTYWVFLPGFGIDYCPDVERAYGELINETGQSFCLAPSPVALDPNEIAGAIRARVGHGGAGPKTPVTLRFYGISMGGMIAYDVARLLRARDPNVTVDAIIFDSSPAGPNSVSGIKQLAPRLGGLVNRTPNLPFGIPTPLKGGPLNRMGVHVLEALVANLSDHRWPLSIEDVNFAWYKATRVTGRGVTNQLDYLNSFYPPSWPPEDPTIRFAYFGAANPDDDTTVDVRRAQETYRRLVAPHELWVYPVPQGAHASADSTVAGYRSTLQAFLRDARIPTIADMQAERLRTAERSIPVGP